MAPKKSYRALVVLIFCALAGALSATPASAIVGDLKPFTADPTWHCGPRTEIPRFPDIFFRACVKLNANDHAQPIAIVGNNRDLQIADVFVWQMNLFENASDITPGTDSCRSRAVPAHTALACFGATQVPYCFPSRLQARVNIRVRNVDIPELISTMPVCGDSR